MTEAPIINLNNNSILPENIDVNLHLAIPTISLFHNQITLYYDYVRPKIPHTQKPTQLKNLENNKVKNKISKGSLRHIKKYLTAWGESIEYYNSQYSTSNKIKKHKLIMLTLTLPSHQEYPDNWYKRELFGRFIDTLKYHYHIKHYFIRYENQENGRIHAHLIIDKYIKYKAIKILYNNMLESKGLMNDYKEKYNRNDPPSCWLSGPKKNENLINYLVGYVSKKSKYKPVDGRKYAMSETLKDIDVFRSPRTYTINETLEKIIQKNPGKVYEQDYYTVIKMNEDEYIKYFTSEFKRKVKQYYLSVYNYLYRGGLHPDEVNKKYNESKSGRVDELVITQNNISNLKPCINFDYKQLELNFSKN